MPYTFESKLFQSDYQSVLPPFLGSGGRPAMTSAGNTENHAVTEIGIMLLDSTGTVVFSDRSAKQHCERGDGLSIESGTLQILTSDGRFRGAQLHRFALNSERTVHFVARKEKLPLEVRFLPLPAPQLAERFLVCLLRDEEQERSIQLRLLCLQYRLSPAEAQLCFLIRDGHSLSEAAIQLSTTYNAVRARLKRVFEKTGVQRQTDLVRLLLYRSALEMSIQNRPEHDRRVAMQLKNTVTFC
jgi:DNA-binding CsgD family transcriptional regulator